MSAGPQESRPWKEQDSRLALETEPWVFFHPVLAGLTKPGAVQPVGGKPGLEEEPVTWPQCDI